jgi:hypothetical protein
MRCNMSYSGIKRRNLRRVMAVSGKFDSLTAQ